MQTTAFAGDATGFKKAGVRGTTMLMVAAWLIPFGIHLIPWNGSAPLGAHLLPMFWATFVAVYLYGAGVGLVVGLFAPMLNLAVTGFPAWKFLSVLSFELVIFALVTAWLTRRARTLWIGAPLGYLVAKLGSTGLQSFAQVFGDIGAPGAFLIRSISTAWVGLIVLAVIHFALTRFDRSSPDWDQQ